MIKFSKRAFKISDILQLNKLVSRLAEEGYKIYNFSWLAILPSKPLYIYTEEDGELSFNTSDQAHLKVASRYLLVDTDKYLLTPHVPCLLANLLEHLDEGLHLISEGRSPSKTAVDFLTAALSHMKARSLTYDSTEGERSMGKAINAFNTVTGNSIKESEGWLLLQLLKDVRQWSREGFHADSAEDCVAYAALKAESLFAEGSITNYNKE